MSVNFEFNAPQFFNTSDDPDADKFFDVSVDEKDNNETPINKTKANSTDVETENKDPHPDGDTVDHCESEKSSRKVLNEIVNQNVQHDDEKMQNQKVISIENEKNLLKGFEDLHISKFKSCKSALKTPVRNTTIFDGIEIEKSVPKKHSMITRLDSKINTPAIKLRNRCVPIVDKPTRVTNGSHEDVSVCLDFKKSFAMKRKASPLSGKKKFISIAERIQHFHYDTPERFRRIPSKQIVPQNIRLRGTIPKTPVLTAKFRCRPVDFPDEKKREELELEEMKKNRVKAYPLNEKILKEPVLNLKFPVEKKPTTVPEPFRLTETKKKELPRSPVFVFKAHPMPSTIFNGPTGVPPKKAVKTTVPLTPNIKVPVRFSHVPGSASKPSTPRSITVPKTTKIEPFSFDQKIHEMRVKKEETVKKVLEEERKAFSSFKARPLPSYLGKEIFAHVSGPNKSENKGNCLNSVHGSKKDLDDKNSNETTFKARPATVTHQKPFVPVLPKHDVVLPEEIVLNTEKRAAERQKFDEKIKKKEELQCQILQEKKDEEEKLEQQLKLEHRKLTEFKAKPAPKFKPFEIRPADPSNLTIPKSPRFVSGKQCKDSA